MTPIGSALNAKAAAKTHFLIVSSFFPSSLLPCRFAASPKGLAEEWRRPPCAGRTCLAVRERPRRAGGLRTGTHIVSKLRSRERGNHVELRRDSCRPRYSSLASMVYCDGPTDFAVQV